MSSPWSRTPRRLASLTRLICLLISPFTYITHFATALASRFSRLIVSPAHNRSPLRLRPLVTVSRLAISRLSCLSWPAVYPVFQSFSCPPSLLLVSVYLVSLASPCLLPCCASLHLRLLPSSLYSVESTACISLLIYINKHRLIVIQLLSTVWTLV